MKKQKTIKQFEKIIEKCNSKIKKLDKKWNKIHKKFVDYNGYDFNLLNMKYKLDLINTETNYLIKIKEHCLNMIYGIREIDL